MKPKRTMSILTATAACIALTMSGCGGAGMEANQGTTSATTTTSPVIVSGGDAPLTNVLAAAVTLSAISLTSSSGTVVQLLSQPRTLELSQLGGIQAPINTGQLAAGTYTTLSVTVSGAQITYLGAGNAPVTATATIPAASATASITLNPSVVASGNTNDAVSLRLDFDLAASLDLTNNVVTFTPVIGAVGARVQGQPPASNQLHIVGVVSAVSTQNQTLTLAAPDTQLSVTLNVNSSTVFGNNLSLATLTAGSAIEAVVQMQPDGTLLALMIQAANGGGPIGSGQRVDNGIVTAVTTSNGALTSFTMITQQPLQPLAAPPAPQTGTGAGADLVNTPSNGTQPPPPGQVLTVTIGSNTTYSLSTEAQNAGMPSFDATQIFSGAGVQVTSTGAQSTATSVTALQIAPWAINPIGTTSGGVQTSGSGFVISLALNAMDPIAHFSGQTAIAVDTNTATMFGPPNVLTSANVASLASGTPLTVHGVIGLASGTYTVYAENVFEENH